MPKQITEYELLISCPSDVKNELNIISEIVDTFNHTFGSLNNAKIVTKHWSKDSFPQSGGKPQELLNKQFVLGCDAAVAVFGTRFGTPTDEYGSGTEEEIEELIKSGKQVFLYFSDCPVNPSQVDNAQYEKVKEFRKKYKDQGLYWTYDDLDTFKKDFLNHLSLYFVALLQGNPVTEKAVIKSNLLLKGVLEGKLVDKVVPFCTKYSESKYISILREKIISKINEINSIILPISATAHNTDENSTENQESLPEKLNEIKQLNNLSNNYSFQNLFSEQVTIDNKDKQVIDGFSSDNSIVLSSSFYFLGNLIKQKNLFGGVFGPSYSLSGSDDENNKFDLICKLAESIHEYIASVNYFSDVDKKVFISLALCNFGTDYDEDIDIKIFVNCGFLCFPKDLPFPEFEAFNIAISSFDRFYKPKNTVTIDDYPDYYKKPFMPDTSSFTNIIGGKSYKQILEEKTSKYNDKRDEIFCYNYFSENDQDIICYNQSYLKQNTNSYLPSYLVFNKVPEKIRYEITSKRFPGVIEGQLTLENLNDPRSVR